jgi:putative FmdB family regulatory protein
VPIYEFRCNSCRRRTSVFTRSIGAPLNAACQHCGSADLSRLMSRVAVLRSNGGDSSGTFDESSLGDVDENDPRSIARWVRKMSGQMGEPLDAEMESDLERLEAGDMPDGFGGGDAADEEFVGAD